MATLRMTRCGNGSRFFLIFLLKLTKLSLVGSFDFLIRLETNEERSG